MCMLVQTWSAACSVSCGLETEIDSSLEKQNQMQIYSCACDDEENGTAILTQNGIGTSTATGIGYSSSSCGAGPWSETCVGSLIGFCTSEGSGSETETWCTWKRMRMTWYTN